jgi:hypothetical protein
MQIMIACAHSPAAAWRRPVNGQQEVEGESRVSSESSLDRDELGRGVYDSLTNDALHLAKVLKSSLN